MPNPELYTLTLNAEQARVLQDACELLARCHMGQFDHAVYRVNPMADRKLYDPICYELKQAVFPELAAYGSYYDITSDKRPDEARVAFDLYSLIRHRLSWDALGGKQPQDRYLTCYRGPYHYSQQPKAKIEKAE